VRFWSEQPEPANNVKPVRRMMGQEEVEHRNILHDTKKATRRPLLLMFREE